MSNEPARQHTVAVIGGGPAGLMAAEVVARAGHAVTVYERMPSLGRKFLLAGRGGLNLTHSEDIGAFMHRYGAGAQHLRSAIEAFPPGAVRAWCEELGQPTFVGSSGRVFPKAMKASPLLRAWLRRLAMQGVGVRLRHVWRGWDDAGRIIMEGPQGPAAIEADAVVLALGGASWPQLGSDGGWVLLLAQTGVDVTRLRPANCGFLVNWSDTFRAKFAGTPLKRLGLTCAGQGARGEAVITAAGIEGGGIYALSRILREAIDTHGAARLVVDLRPDVAAKALEARLSAPRNKQSLSTFLRKAVRLAPVEIGLLMEAAHASELRLGNQAPGAVAALIKAVPIDLVGTAPIARAISTAGGVSFDAIDTGFMLRARPGVFVAGEMLDWEGPTGGYLLQACFATGAAAGRGAVAWLQSRS